LVEIPICDDGGTPTGEVVRVPDPPPPVWSTPTSSVLELRSFERLTRFGCGCIREAKPAYVRVDRPPAAA
jgi:hypothetical protein